MTDRIQELESFFHNMMMDSYEINAIKTYFDWMDDEMLHSTPAELLSAYLRGANSAVDSWVENVHDTPDEGDHDDHKKWQDKKIADYESMRPKNKRLAELQAIFAGA
jgi:hypothetical protein